MDRELPHLWAALARHRGERLRVGQGRQGRMEGAVEADRRRHGEARPVLRHGGGDRFQRAAAVALRIPAGRREWRIADADYAARTGAGCDEEGPRRSSRASRASRAMKRRTFLAMPAILSAAPATGVRIDE